MQPVKAISYPFTAHNALVRHHSRLTKEDRYTTAIRLTEYIAINCPPLPVGRLPGLLSFLCRGLADRQGGGRQGLTAIPNTTGLPLRAASL